MMAFRVREWLQRYEVTSGGNPATAEALDRLRLGPLAFARLVVKGHDHGASYRRLLEQAGEDLPAAFGLFCKCLELAANQRCEWRGWLLDERQQPLTAEGIADVLSWPRGVTVRCLDQLVGVCWLEAAEFTGPHGNTPETYWSGNSRAAPGQSGNSRESPGESGNPQAVPADPGSFKKKNPKPETKGTQSKKNPKRKKTPEKPHNSQAPVSSSPPKAPESDSEGSPPPLAPEALGESRKGASDASGEESRPDAPPESPNVAQEAPRAVSDAMARVPTKRQWVRLCQQLLDGQVGEGQLPTRPRTAAQRKSDGTDLGKIYRHFVQISSGSADRLREGYELLVSKICDQTIRCPMAALKNHLDL